MHAMGIELFLPKKHRHHRNAENWGSTRTMRWCHKYTSSFYSGDMGEQGWSGSRWGGKHLQPPLTPSSALSVDPGYQDVQSEQYFTKTSSVQEHQGTLDIIQHHQKMEEGNLKSSTKLKTKNKHTHTNRKTKQINIHPNFPICVCRGY